jgi:hypothetical protein
MTSPGSTEAHARIVRVVDPYSAALADAVEAALPGWVERSVTRRMTPWAGRVPDDVAGAARAAGERARAEVGRAVRALLATDVDAQRTNPLSLLRSAVRFPTAVLQAAGVPTVVRDDFAVHAFPDDVYNLAPATWRDVDESLHEPGIEWGAWKAKTVLDRRRREGRR